ncbi:hypothetical protein CI109_104098 [Kwoniella shandongensis]|uniref:Extradiol ring-cleavage dioxygenase class III enzyme subunit B domain-containing protein n=1 Tax=Kwoniella shandongensis TaxID=1734106 RepID=A0A5M6C2L0_9TREE|nr:uncharacterized protein CI109_004017 [Kwoniella shandongensis]KAA5527479.1 hypothetical protein CI109_004017 [Kwoniella shandongensis]
MTNATKRGDVYFLSHGGPPMIEQYHAPPYHGWKKFGKLLLGNKPKGIVVVSAHWENSSGSGVVVNNNPSNPLLYDFYNFPAHFYKLQFKSRHEPEFRSKVIETLKKGDIPVSEQNRGIDHGIFIPFIAALGESIDIPLLQVSLPASSDPHESVKLGKALSGLRDEGYSVIATGQVVHNLRDLFSGTPSTYTKPFLNAVTTAVNSPDPVTETLKLVSHPLYKRAHPTDEHFFPIYVSLGAIAPEDKIEEIYVGIVDVQGKTVDNNGLGWGMWRWSSN